MRDSYLTADPVVVVVTQTRPAEAAKREGLLREEVGVDCMGETGGGGGDC
jgi:hypothetical protein